MFNLRAIFINILLSYANQSGPTFFSLPIRHDIAGSGNEFEKGSQEMLFPADRTPEEVFSCFRYGVTEKVMDVAESQAGHKK